MKRQSDTDEREAWDGKRQTNGATSREANDADGDAGHQSNASVDPSQNAEHAR